MVSNVIVCIYVIVCILLVFIVFHCILLTNPPEYQNFFIVLADNSQDDYTTWSLFLVYVGAALPDFAYRDTNFLPSLEGTAEMIRMIIRMYC